jgi:spermidine/putrescine transport system substrate-binding protein
MKKFTFRSLIVTFWIIIIFGSLYLPKITFSKLDSKTLNIFAWGDILDPSVIAKFEEETGIKVRLSYYASNEELIVKMKATKGEGYDLIIPSDYAVKVLIQNELLSPINKSKLHFWNEINPNLLNQDFDPSNVFSIPLEWEIFGFGIDKEYFSTYPLHESWRLIFDPSIINYKISMTNDPIEAILFAGFYLFNNTDHLDIQKADQVKNLLIKQKKWVEAYANFRGDYFLATRNCPVVVASSSYIWKTMRQFPFVSFVVPKEGTFISIENLAIPAKSEKQKYTYKLINYLFRHDSVKTHFEKFGFFPSTLQSLQNLEIDPIAEKLVNTSSEDFKKFHFSEELISQQQIHDMWVEVKSSN